MRGCVEALLLAGWCAASSALAAAEVLEITGASATPWIAKHEGQLLVETAVALRNAGGPASLWVRVSVPGRPPRVEALGELPRGDHKRKVRHPELNQDGAQVAFELFDSAQCAGQPRAARSIALPKARHWTIYVNHDMHMDIGYTAYQEELKRRIWPNYLDQTFKHIEDSAGWPEGARARRGIESSMLLYDSVLLARDADWIEKLKEYIRQGRIGYAATPCSLAQENMSAEELVRSNYYSLRHLTDMLGGGCAPVANMADNNSLCWSAIDALAGAGVRYYTLRLWGGESRWRRPATLYYVEASRSKNRLLVCDYGDYTKEPFGLKTGKIETVKAAVEKRLMELQRDPGYPCDAVLCQFTNSDNGPTSPAVYQSVKDFHALGYEYPKLLCALPQDFYRHVEERFAKDLPVVRGNFENWWNWGVGSTAYETAIHKQTQDTLAAAEIMATLACVLEPRRAYPYEELATAWKNMVLYAEHTWGPNGSAVNEQWFWKRNTALQPEGAAARVLRESLAAVNACIPARGPAVVVWNFAPWRRTDVVYLDAAALPKPFLLTDAATGKAVPVQVSADGQTMFVAEDVPGLGYKTFTIAEAAAPADNGPAAGLSVSAERIENRFFRVTFDAQGNVVSIQDKRRGNRELVDSNCPHRLNQFVFWQEMKTPITVTEAKLTTASGPLTAALTAEGACFGLDSLRRTVILHRDLPRLDFVNEMIKSPSGFGGQGKGWPKEEGYFVFPLRVGDGFTLRHELPAGNVRPLVDPNPGAPEQLATSCTDHFTVNHWVDVSGQRDFGVTLAPLDAPLVMYGERRARTFDVNYKARAPWLYSYVFNNLWYTNFQKTQPGRVVFRYALQSHDGPDAQRAGWLAGAAQRFGIEAHSHLRAALLPAPRAGDAGTRGAPGFAAEGGSLLPLDQPNVMLIAAKLAEANGAGVILRFTEIEGRETQFTADLACFAPQAVHLTDLVENDREALALVGTKVSVTISGYGFAALRLTFGAAPAAVRDVQATTSAGGTQVSWAAAPDSAHYEVFRGTSADFATGAGTYLASVSVRHLLDRQVHGAVKGKYYYKVRAVRPGHKGPFSPPAAATPGQLLDTTPPATPALRAVALRFDKVSLQWETPTDDVAVKGYKLFRDGQPLADLPAVYNSWVDLRTEIGREYEYAIRAYDDAGNESDWGRAKVSTRGFKAPAPKAGKQALGRAAAGESSVTAGHGDAPQGKDWRVSPNSSANAFGNPARG